MRLANCTFIIVGGQFTVIIMFIYTISKISNGILLSHILCYTAPGKCPFLFGTFYHTRHKCISRKMSTVNVWNILSLYTIAYQYQERTSSRLSLLVYCSKNYTILSTYQFSSTDQIITLSDPQRATIYQFFLLYLSINSRAGWVYC